MDCSSAAWLASSRFCCQAAAQAQTRPPCRCWQGCRARLQRRRHRSWELHSIQAARGTICSCSLEPRRRARTRQSRSACGSCRSSLSRKGRIARCSLHQRRPPSSPCSEPQVRVLGKPQQSYLAEQMPACSAACSVWQHPESPQPRGPDCEVQSAPEAVTFLAMLRAAGAWCMYLAGPECICYPAGQMPACMLLAVCCRHAAARRKMASPPSMCLPETRPSLCSC